MPEKWNTAQAAAQCCGTQFTTVPLGKHPVCTICHHASHLNSVTSLPLPVAGCFEACRLLLLVLASGGRKPTMGLPCSCSPVVSCNNAC